jgi:hypothetical protein
LKVYDRGSFLEYLPALYHLDDEEIILKTLRFDHEVLSQFVSENLLNNREFQVQVVKVAPRAIQKLPDSAKR